MGRMSNRDRIARAAEEAKAAAAEKAATKATKATKKATKPGSASRPRREATPARVKIVWDVTSPTGAKVKTFAYPDKAAAEAEALALTRSTGRDHAVRANKVPME